MQRIGIVCGGGIVSGKEIMVMELADGLREKGYHIEILTSRWGTPEFAERFEKLGFPVHKFWFGFISITFRLDCIYMTLMQMLRWPHLLVGFRRFLRVAQPKKVIHTNWHSLFTLLPLLKAERDVYWVHEVMPNKPQYRWVFRWLSRRLARFVCVSTVVARSLADIGIAPNKIRMLHNGLSDPVGPGRVALSMHTPPRIGIVGQVGPWKGHADLVEAFGQIASKHPAAELHIFGTSAGDFEQQLRRRSEALGIAGRIVWHGFVAERAAIYSDIDICAVPSRSPDPLPTTAIEAAFFGLPVVASSRGGLPEIVQDKVTGLLFEAGYVQNLAACLDELAGNAELRKAMGKAARERAETHFARTRFVDGFVSILGG